MGRWTFKKNSPKKPESDQEYEELSDAESRVPHAKQSAKAANVYQYRTFSGFWAILKSDSFWATNARFSNDAEEQRFGANVLRVLGINEMADSKAKISLDENYIVCFCKEDDKLSQWRGYAPDGGCSIGFDLMNMAVRYHCLEAQEETKGLMTAVQLSPVFYLDPQQKGDDDSYKRICEEQLQTDGPGENADSHLSEIRRRVPYIKHKGFQEEDEYRLVFENHDGKLDRCIRYKDSDTPDIKIPYIVVKAGDPTLANRPCVVRIGLNDLKQERKLEADLRVRLPKTEIHGCHATFEQQHDLPDAFCRGCTMRQWKDCRNPKQKTCRFRIPTKNELGLSSDNRVFISQGKNQEEIFESVYRYVSEFNQSFLKKNGGVKEEESHKKCNQQIKIWCEGHLPIRTITVGPSKNQKNVKEAISYYCKHTYWLRDVAVDVSSIPFRKSL